MAFIQRAGRTVASRACLRVLAWVWILALIVGSLQPARPGIVKAEHWEIHWIAFGGAVLLLLSLAHTLRQEIIRALMMFFLGFSLETLQVLIYRGPMEWNDVLHDGAAVLAAFTLYRFAGAWKPAQEPVSK